jgi:hypothetical protein
VAKNPDNGKTPPKQTEPETPKTFMAVFEGDSGAEIQVDGKSVGQTPNAKAQNLAIGKTYKFVARRSGYKPYTGEFSYDGNPELKVDFALEKEQPKEPKEPPKTVEHTRPPPPKAAVKLGKFAASTKPAGAQIWVDNKYSNRDTPVAIGNPLMLPVGNHKIVFKLGGKSTKPQVVNITDSEVAKLINVPIE